MKCLLYKGTYLPVKYIKLALYFTKNITNQATLASSQGILSVDSESRWDF